MSKFIIPNRQIDIGSEPYEKRKARKVFSTIGLATFLLLLIATIIQIVVIKLLGDSFAQLAELPWFTWVIGLGPIYLCGVPVFLLVLRRIKPYKIPPQKLSASTFLQIALICFAAMNIGGAVTNALIQLLQYLAGGELNNSIEQIMGNSNLIFNLIATVLFAPFFEEIVFRKAIIDRSIKYGENVSALLSASLFAVFHANIFQFIYTFTLGYALAIVYIKTGKIIYPILIHAFSNLLYGNLVPALSTTKFAMIIFAITFIMGIAGIILLVSRRKHLTLSRGEVVIPKGNVFKVIYLNFGFILFFVCSCVIAYLNLM